VNNSLSSVFFTVLVVGGLILVGTSQFSTVKASANVIGILRSDTTWTKANSPYTLTGPVAVNAGVILTIEAGVTVNLGGYYIQVNGTLRTVGTSTDKVQFGDGQITFTSVSQGWNEQTGSGSIIENAVLSQTSISSTNSLKITGSTIAGEVIVGTSSIISNNVITGRNFSPETPPYALTIGGSSVISGNTIHGAESHGQAMVDVYDYYYAIKVNGHSAVISNNIITGDVTGDSMTISHNTLTGGINADSSTISSNTITGEVYGTSLVISNNTIAGGKPTYSWMRASDPSSAIRIGGDQSLISNNTITSPAGGFGITITNEWYGITFTKGNVYVLNNIISNSITGIRAAGDAIIQGNSISDSTGCNNAYVHDIGYGIEIGHITFHGFNSFEIGVGNVVIRHNKIRNNPVGIGGLEEGTATIENNIIVNNTKGIETGSQVTIRNNTITDSSIGIALNKSPLATINQNNIQNYSQYSVKLENIPNDVDATNNWWGTTDKQAIAQKIYDNKNDFNLGNVIFEPFLTEPNTAAAPASSPQIPEFPSLIALSLLILVTFAIAVALKRKKDR